MFLYKKIPLVIAISLSLTNFAYFPYGSGILLTSLKEMCGIHMIMAFFKGGSLNFVAPIAIGTLVTIFRQRCSTKH